MKNKPKKKSNIESILKLDKLIHEPARLAIMTALMECESGDFTFLLKVTGLTKGNLSSHLEKLALGNLITIEKRFLGRVPNTFISLTAEGRKAIGNYWRIIKHVGEMIPKEK